MPRVQGTDQNLTGPDRSRSGPPEIEEARAGAQSRAEPRERALHGGGWRLGARVVGGAVLTGAAIDDDPCLLHTDHALRRLDGVGRSEEHTSELQSLAYLVCRLLLEKKKTHTDVIHF